MKFQSLQISFVVGYVYIETGHYFIFQWRLNKIALVGSVPALVFIKQIFTDGTS